MAKEIMRGEAFLSQKSKPATRSDLPVVQDLLDTLEANKERWQNEKFNEKFQERFRTFTGWTAQIIQREADHCEGIII